MEFTPHKYISQENYLHKLNRGILHRAVNRIMGVEDQLHDVSHKIENLACSEPLIFSPWFDETGRKVAYGRNALPRLRREMSHKNEMIACCAIRQLSDLVHDPEIAVEALKMNIVARFVKTIQSENLILKERTLDCLKSLATQPSGLLNIVNNQYIIKNIRECVLHPTSAIIRSQTAVTVNALAQNYIAVHTLVEAAFVKVLMTNLIEAKDYTEENNPLGFESIKDMKDMMVLHLDTLDKLLEDSDGPKIEAIAYDAFLLAPLLTGECAKLKKAAADLFRQIAKHSIGKDGIFHHGLIEPLCHEVVNCPDIDIKSRLASILQFAMIHKEARKEAFKTELFNYLIETSTRDNLPSDFKLSLLKMLTLFAEMPEGRIVLRSLLEKEICTCIIKLDGTETMQNAIHILINEIMWEP